MCSYTGRFARFCASVRRLTGLSGCAATASLARRSAACAASRVVGKSAGLKDGYSVGAGRTALHHMPQPNMVSLGTLHSEGSFFNMLVKKPPQC